jgi:hypothetical protein
LTDVNYYIFICGKKLHMLNYKNKNWQEISKNKSNYVVVKT